MLRTKDPQRPTAGLGRVFKGSPGPRRLLCGAALGRGPGLDGGCSLRAPGKGVPGRGLSPPPGPPANSGSGFPAEAAARAAAPADRTPRVISVLRSTVGNLVGMGLRERTTASAAAAGVLTLMMVAGCGAGGGPAAGVRSAAGSSADALSAPAGGAGTSATGSAGAVGGVVGGAPSTAAAGGTGGVGGGSGGGPIGLLPSAGLTGAVGTAVTTGCKNADDAWSAFRSAYAAATSNPDRSAAAAAAASIYAQVVQSVTRAVDPNDTSAAYRARAQDVARHATTVLNDLQTLVRDLQAGDTNAAAILYSSANPLSPMQLDQAAFASDCGS